MNDNGGTDRERAAHELARVVACEECVRRGDRTILRDDTSNLPQPGYVGPEYVRTRVLLVGQNPGTSTPEFHDRDERYAAALCGVRDHPSDGTMAALQDVLEDIVPGWPVARHFPLGDCGLLLQDIAYCNLVRCRTSRNAAPSTLMVRNCLDHFGRWLDWLQPAIVVCIGKWAHDRIAEELDRRGIPHGFINRQRSLPTADRQANRREVVEMVRRALGAGEQADPSGSPPGPGPDATGTDGDGGCRVRSSPEENEMPDVPTSHTTADGFEVRVSQATRTLYRLDVYHEGTLIGEYERSSAREVERKIQEVVAARQFLLGVYREHGQWQVRWSSSKGTKCIRVDGQEMGEIPAEHWRRPAWMG